MTEREKFEIYESSSFLDCPSILIPHIPKTLDIHNDTERENFFKETALKAYTLASSYFTDLTGKSFQPSMKYQGQRVRTEEDLETIKSRINHEGEKKIAAEDAKRQRFMAKFAKEAEKKAKLKKQDERHKDMRKLQDLKNTKDSKLRASKLKSLMDKDSERNAEGSDFEVEIDEDEVGSIQQTKHQPKKESKKREYKNSKYGFGGKKRGLKKNTEESLNDFSSYSNRKNKRPFPGVKGGKVKKNFSKKNRPGKTRRQHIRNKKGSFNQRNNK